MSAPSASGYFQRIDRTRYRPTGLAQGAWADDELHMAPVSGVVIDALERFLGDRQGPALEMTRISFDILGKLHATDLEVQVRVVRPGRTIELLEATVEAGGRAVLQARAWLLAVQDTSTVTGGLPDRLPAPETLTPAVLTDVWTGGFVSSLDIRYCETPSPGRARVWLSTEVPLLAGESASDLAQLVGLMDTANGVAVRESPTEWIFPNVDLTIHLYRQPRGPWIGLDTTVTFGARGHGLTSTVLHDAHGPVGRAEQILTVRSLSPSSGD